MFAYEHFVSVAEIILENCDSSQSSRYTLTKIYLMDINGAAIHIPLEEIKIFPLTKFVWTCPEFLFTKHRLVAKSKTKTPGLLSPKLEGEGRCEGKKPGRKEEEAFNKGKKPLDISMLTTSNLVSPRLSKSATMRNDNPCEKSSSFSLKG